MRYTVFAYYPALRRSEIRVNEYRTTLVFSVANVPGVLYKSLGFETRRRSLKIESRPLRGSPFEYLFYLDILGKADSGWSLTPAVALTAQSVRVLGTYPRFKGQSPKFA
jgi:prephenate dehydratase